MANFKQRWNIKSNRQLLLIIVVFAVTGSSAAYVIKPLLALVGVVKSGATSWHYYLLYVLFIFPVYQILLVSFGFFFGQFRFFWSFEKKLLKKCGLGLLVPKKEKPE